MKKVMAANRGEIAIRILRAANELGLRTVAIYSQEDRLGLHRYKADEAYLIGQGMGPVQAYLDIKGIVALALEKGVDAIHPGYGFLSENPAFARACEDAGIIFVGPTSELLEKLGDKTVARRVARKAGIPVLPGTEVPISSTSGLQAKAREIGYPLIVKAAHGGGGRGMRVVKRPGDLLSAYQEAHREASAIFHDGSLFLERLVAKARHVEVQILADNYGNALHLHERDCSVQRRHQKVVEIAPAVGLSPDIRKKLTEAAVTLAKAVGYRNAGTVEFLVDAQTEEFYFIEVNPRIQVEHTVTEMVTGVDIARCQLQIAQGDRLDGETMLLPPQEEIPLNGYALQCRVTTEDPSNNFVPDYGRLQAYRSAAGFGVRLDAASAYAGAVITPYYDSLLVKVTVWGRNFNHACRRMDRALREFRIRGVKTNIPFLENVVNHPKFQSGEVLTSFIDDSPELFRFKVRHDRATKLLTYLGDVIVNGNPAVNSDSRPEVLLPAPVPERQVGAPPAGTRQRLDALGAEKFAAWTRSQKRLLLTDTTFRDAHQSLLATRVRTCDMLAIASYVAHRLHGLYSLEMWGGATFDASLRFLHEDPWARLRQLREAIPNICFQMLLRGSNAVGYKAYPDNVVREFIREAGDQGIDIFRVFDSLNWLPNMRIAMETVRKTGKVCEATVCYTGDILDPTREKYNLEYYTRFVKELERMGAHTIAIKDMAGLCKPYAAYRLVKALRDVTDLPVHFHTHDTSGVSAVSVLKASEAGVDIADAAIASMSGSTSQPNLNSIAAALAHTPRDPRIDVEALNFCADYWEVVRTYYKPFDTGPPTGSARVYEHEIPGGQYTNLKQQARAMGLAHQWVHIVKTYADVNRLFGDIVKVTPSSKAVGDMALFLVSHGMTTSEFARLSPDHSHTLPNSVVDMFSGVLGVPEGGWPKKVQAIILRGRKPQRGRPGASLKAADFEETSATVEKKIGHRPTKAEVLTYLMFPKVFQDRVKIRQTYGDLDVLPTLAFLFGMQDGEEITVDLEPGKTLFIKFLTLGDPHPDGSRTVFFELNGQPREITVRDQSLNVKQEVKTQADPNVPGHVGAPIPGAVSSIAIELNQPVRKGDRLLTLEAMKMQTTIYAPVAGKITQRLVQVGESVEPKQLLLIIE